MVIILKIDMQFKSKSSLCCFYCLARLPFLPQALGLYTSKTHPFLPCGFPATYKHFPFT